LEAYDGNGNGGNMSEYLTIEQVKDDLHRVYDVSKIQHVFYLLDRLSKYYPEKDCAYCCKRVLSIIDSHLAPEKPSELESLRKENEELKARIEKAVKIIKDTPDAN